MNETDTKALEKVLEGVLQTMHGELAEAQKTEIATLKQRVDGLEKAKQEKAIAEAKKEGYDEGTSIGSRVLKLEDAKIADDIWKKEIGDKVQNWTKLGWILLTATVSLLGAVILMFIRTRLEGK